MKVFQQIETAKLKVIQRTKPGSLCFDESKSQVRSSSVSRET